jgi:4-amino-4-deoxy-L-arabinose transferase-like glycosyltransferase
MLWKKTVRGTTGNKGIFAALLTGTAGHEERLVGPRPAYAIPSSCAKALTRGLEFLAYNGAQVLGGPIFSVKVRRSIELPTRDEYEMCTSPAHAGLRTWVALALSALMLGALALRLQVVWQRTSDVPDEAVLRLAGDEVGYEELAYALLRGAFIQSPVRLPAYPMLIAATYHALGERSPAKLLYVQAFVGVVAVPLTYLLARRLTGIIPALVAAGIVALDDSLIWHARGIYTEIVYTPLLLVALLALFSALQAPRLWRFAWAGASMAVVTLCRPTTALLPLLLPLVLPWGWALKQRAGVCLAYSLTMVAVIAPWTLHNWRTYHRFLPLTISAGALWYGSPEFYHLTQRQRRFLDIWGNELNPQHNGGHDPHTIEGDRYFTRRAIRSIRSEPGVYVTYSLKKAVYLWLGNPVVDWPYGALYHWAVMREWYPYSPQKLLNMFVARQLPVMALMALVFLAVRRRIRPLVPLVVVCAYFTLVYMLTWAEMRYSEPLHPLLAIMIVTAGRDGFDVFKQHRAHVSLQT